MRKHEMDAACVVCDFENAKIVGRADYRCPKCGRDFTLEYLFWAQVAHPEWLTEKMEHK
jgi:transposase-like protein